MAPEKSIMTSDPTHESSNQTAFLNNSGLLWRTVGPNGQRPSWHHDGARHPPVSSQCEQGSNLQLCTLPPSPLSLRRAQHTLEGKLPALERRVRMKWNLTGKSPGTILRIYPFGSLLTSAAASTPAWSRLPTDSRAVFK